VLPFKAAESIATLLRPIRYVGCFSNTVVVSLECSPVATPLAGFVTKQLPAANSVWRILWQGLAYLARLGGFHGKRRFGIDLDVVRFAGIASKRLAAAALFGGFCGKDSPA